MEVQPELSTSPVVVDSREPIYTPTLNCHDSFFTGAPAKTTEELLEAAHQRIEELEAALNKQTIYKQLQMKPNSSIRFYTFFPSFDVLVATFRALSATAQNMYSGSQMQRLRNKRIKNVEGLGKTMQGCKLSFFSSSEVEGFKPSIS